MPEPAALIPSEGLDYAAALAAPPLTNLRRTGGEMFAWTDRDPRRGPALPDGAVLRHLLLPYARPDRTVLVAGPHSDDLVAALADGGAAVTWLLRSLADAEEAARTHPTVTVLAGSAVKLDPADRFDLVVAADGVERLNSTEGEQLTAAELIEQLAGAVRPGGALLLVHDNRLGVHHTVRLEPGARENQDAAWYPLDENDDLRPASREQLAACLAEAGLTVGASYAAFPHPAVPTVLLGDAVLGDLGSPLRPRLGAVLSQAFAAAYRRRPVLSDPRRLIARALSAGAEDTVAPAWLVIARAPGPASDPGTRRHDLLIGDARGSFAYEMAAREGEVVTTVLQPPASPLERAGLRRIAEPPATVVAGGYVLEDRLLRLCAAADLRRLRMELTQFDSWLRDQATDGVLAGPAALAGLADVLVGDAGPALLPTRWEPVEPVPVSTAATRVLWQLAVQLITSGRPHPWPITSSAADLTATLLGMVGRGLPAADLRAAVDLQIAMETAEFGLTLAEQQTLRLQLLAVAPGTAPVDVPGYRELTEALWRQRYQFTHVLAMMEWTEQIIESRDRMVSKMDWEIQFYRKSWPGRVLMVGRSGYHVLKRDARKVRRMLRRN